MILVVGASGATGHLLVENLLRRGEKVKIVVRSLENLPDTFHENSNLIIVHASLLDLSDTEMKNLLFECNAVASCLGHNLTMKGIFGKPHKLVTNAVMRICTAIESNKPLAPVKFVLMNTTGNSNRDLLEKISILQKCIIGLIRLLLPPHVDNEQAAEFLRTKITNNKMIEWVTVRPDGLIDELQVTQYSIYLSPTRSAIFDAGKTSRINVGNFMADLITDCELWNQWKGKMPVIYNDN